ncbi:MAG: FKBP-type peptidyl-prolyl cis-trans isomerase [Pseudomonadales bacterium]|jgi:FKBP-type peptidyl-prolyl cis-trans isomerase FklB|nr:FKBP-type peptidyl-prolyl cis-trans isomerase [Pseudomonadales bacterium]
MSERYTSPASLASYAVGRQIGEQLASQPFPGLHLEALLDGLGTVLRQEPSPYSENQLRSALDDINRQVQRMQKQQANAMAAAGEKFLQHNATRPEVTTTASGLQYEVLQAGSGRRPTGNDTVRVHYHGTLVDGTVFDSSIERGEAIEFAVSGVISGWTEALQLMQEGARYKLYIPHQLAYGASGAGGAIAPYSTLIFEVELLNVR